MTRDSPVDVFVIEATGASLAARLAGAGKSVVVLEAGRARTLCDLMSSQTWSRLLKWYGAPVLPGGRHPFGHNMATGSGLGGAAIYHYASLLRLHVGDFTLLSDSGVGLDWPIGDDDQASNYDRIRAEMGVAGDAAAEVLRPPGVTYSMPPLHWFGQGEIPKGGFEKAGLRVAPSPMAVMRAARVTAAWTSPQRAFAHASGGTVIWRDPTTSVTNDVGQLRGHANLVVAGGGLFPSIGADSPTFTVLPLANRTAARIVSDWERFAA